MECPVCGRAQVTSVKCPQCETDLTALWCVEQQNSLFLRDSQRKLQCGDAGGSLVSAMASLAWNSDSPSGYRQVAHLLLERKAIAECISVCTRGLADYPSDSDLHDCMRLARRQIARRRLWLSTLLLLLAAALVVSVWRTVDVTERSLAKDREILASQAQIAVLSDSVKHIEMSNKNNSSFWYRLRRGDTLWKLAARFLGTPESTRAIQDLNPALVGSENKLSIGTMVEIPINGPGFAK